MKDIGDSKHKASTTTQEVIDKTAPKPRTLAEPVFLYVENDTLSREVMEMLLTMVLGYKQVTIFEDSQDFVTKVQNLQPRPNVIFLDIQMTPLDGFQMFKHLRSLPNYKSARIIALTANVMSTHVQALKAAGFDGLIGKPILLDTFPLLLKNILAGEQVWFVS